MKRKWIAVISSCLVLALAVTGVVVYWNRTPAYATIYEDSMADLSDPTVLAGLKDYIFVGKVLETHDYQKEKLLRRFPDGAVDEGLWTECVVRVVKNMKGSLPEGQSLSLYKAGGYTKDLSAYNLYQNDLIPEEGGLYIFTGNATADGLLACGGNYATVALEQTVAEDAVETSPLYQQYCGYIADQTAPRLDYVHYVAAADPGYSDTINAEKEASFEKAKADRVTEVFDPEQKILEQLWQKQQAQKTASIDAAGRADVPQTEPVAFDVR